MVKNCDIQFPQVIYSRWLIILVEGNMLRFSMFQFKPEYIVYHKPIKLKMGTFCVTVEANRSSVRTLPRQGPFSVWPPYHDMETLFPLHSLYERNRRSPTDSSHKGSVMRTFDNFFVVGLNNLLNTWYSCWWFETPYHSCGFDVITDSRASPYHIFYLWVVWQHM